MHRTNKRLLAEQVAHLLSIGMKPGQIAKALGKDRQRIFQIRKLFELPDWKRARVYKRIGKLCA